MKRAGTSREPEPLLRVGQASYVMEISVITRQQRSRKIRLKESGAGPMQRRVLTQARLPVTPGPFNSNTNWLRARWSTAELQNPPSMLGGRYERRFRHCIGGAYPKSAHSNV